MASKSLEGYIWFIFHWKATSLKKCIHGLWIKVRMDFFILPYLTLAWKHEKNVLPADGKRIWNQWTEMQRPSMVCCRARLQLSWWRGKGRHLKQSLITKTARSWERERTSKAIERAERERAGVGQCSGNLSFSFTREKGSTLLGSIAVAVFRVVSCFYDTQVKKHVSWFYSTPNNKKEKSPKTNNSIFSFLTG